MKHALFTFFIAFALISNAQEVAVEYPYNPDIDTDEQIGVTDLMGIQSGFGEDFEPEGIIVNSVELTAFLMEMQATPCNHRSITIYYRPKGFFSLIE